MVYTFLYVCGLSKKRYESAFPKSFWTRKFTCNNKECNFAHKRKPFMTKVIIVLVHLDQTPFGTNCVYDIAVWTKDTVYRSVANQWFVER